MAAAPLDDLDRGLLAALAEDPRAGIMELSRQLGVARATVQSRLDKLVERGVVTGFGPNLDPPALGYSVLAFTTLEIAQGRLDDVVAHLRAIPEVLEAHAISGPGDLYCRLVARTNQDLLEVIGSILEVQGIVRTSTAVALSAPIAYRTLPLVGPR